MSSMTLRIHLIHNLDVEQEALGAIHIETIVLNYITVLLCLYLVHHWSIKPLNQSRQTQITQKCITQDVVYYKRH